MNDNDFTSESTYHEGPSSDEHIPPEIEFPPYEVRNELREEEYMDEEIGPYRKAFFGEISGVILSARGKGDNHVCFQVIHEDDGHWFLSRRGASSSWFEDYIGVLEAAKKWCEENCDPDVVEGRQYGWKFKN